MKTAVRFVLFSWLVLVSVLCFAQESMDYRSRTVNPEANLYTIATQTDSLLKTLPPDTAEEGRGLFFARWKWFWESRMGDAIDGAKTGKFTHYMGVMKSMVQSPPCLSPSAYPANWNLLGPIQLPRQEMGRIDAVALDPNNPSVAYAGAPNGGLWRTTDIDAAVPLWQNITDQAGLPGIGIGDILIDPSNSDIIYIATGFYTGGFGGGVGVLKTTNGTDPLPTWEFTGLNFNPFMNEIAAVKKLVMSPVDHNTIYAITNKDIFKTTDGGDSWPSMNLSTTVASNVHLDIADLALDPLNSSNIIVSATKTTVVDETTTLVSMSLWRWVESAGQWGEVTLSALPDNNEIRLSIANGSIYAMYKSGTIPRIDISTDGGLTWTLHTTTDNYGPLFIVSPLNPNIMYLGDGSGRVIYKSIDSGANFIAITYYNGTYNGTSTHADIRALQLFQASSDGLNDILLAGTDGGVLYSTTADAEPPPNGKVYWRDVNGSGLAVGQFYGLAGSEKVPGRIVAGAQDNGLATHEDGNWTNRIVGDAYRTVIDREDPMEVTGERIGWGSTYANSQLNDGSYLNKSIAGGQSWPIYTPQPTWGNPNNTDNFNMGVQYSPDIWNVLDSPIQLDHENKMYIGFHDLFRYDAANNSWIALSDFTIPAVTPDDPNALPVQWQCSAFAIAPANPDVIYFAFGGQTWSPDNSIKHKLWKTEDGGASWSDVTQDLPVNWYTISGIVLDPDHANRVWVSIGNIGSYGALSEPYNGSSRVYYTSDGGATWTDYSMGLTPLPINTITYEQGTNDGLYVGTDVGVFYTNRTLYNSDDITSPQNSGWVCFRDNMPACIVTGLEVNYAANRLRASTFGRGIWESSLACPLNTDLYFTTTSAAGLSNTFQEASNDISIVADAGDIGLSDLTGRAGNTVHVSATGSSRVHLVPGSHLFIHPCDGPDNSFHPKMEITSTGGGLGEEAEHDRETGLKVYPNPSDGKMTIELVDAERSDISQIRFVDPLGKVVFTGTMKGRVQTIEVNGLRGIYMLLVLQGKEQHLAKVVIN